MRFCTDHWTRLRSAIEQRELGHLIAADGQRVAASLTQELAAGKPSPATFEPLMAAHWAIASRALHIIGGAAPDAVMYVMQSDDAPEDAVDLDRYPRAAAGATWPRCPLCYLGLAHELTCSDAGCALPLKDGYAWMIDRAAEDQVEAWKKIQAEEQGAA